MQAPWMEQMATEAWKEAQKRKNERSQAKQLEKYVENPVAFCTETLQETYTRDVTAVMESVRDNPITIARSGNATGKSQPVWTQAATPHGWKSIGSLKIGDLVFGADGKPTTVIEVFPQGLQPTYEVIFNDGSSTLASADHLWNVRGASQKYRGKGYKTVTTLQMAGYSSSIHIPCTQPVQYPDADLPADPYLIGAFLGDGYLHGTPELTVHDSFIRDKVAQIGEKDGFIVRLYRGGVTLRLSNGYGVPSAFNTALKQQGLYGTKSETKFIPDAYMRGSIEQRKQLLAGLMDTDGYIDARHSISFTTTSPKLAMQVVELVQSLGGWATTGIKHTSGQLAYNVYLKTPFCPFSVPYKVERWRDPAESLKPIHRVVRSVRYAGEAESVCIQVDNQDGLYLTEHYIVTHNTHGAARVAIWFYRVFPDAKIYLTAAPPLDNLRRILWGEIMSIVRKKPELFANDTLRSLSIARNPQSFITGVAIPTSGTREDRIAKFSGRHAPHLLFIVDEGDAVPDEIYTGIESCMSGGMARLLIMFNPKAQVGPVYQKEFMRQANVVHLSALTHPNVLQDQIVIPGAVDRQTTVRRINEWTRPLNPGEHQGPDTFTPPAFLIGAQAVAMSGELYPPLLDEPRKIVEPAFSYMVLGEYPAQSEFQLINKAWVDNARARWDAYVAQHGELPPAETRPIMSIDVAEMGVDANVSCLRYGGFIPRLITWSGVDTDFSALHAIGLYKTYNPIICFTDATGVGSSLAPNMARRGKDMGLRSFGIKVAGKPTPGAATEFGEFYILRDQLWWSCREWLRTDPGAMLPPDPYLCQELTTPMYNVQNGKIRVTGKDIMRQQLRRSPDRADALCLTFYPVARPTIQMLVK